MDAPTFFGEIVDQFSRAVEDDDDEDDDVVIESSCSARWTPQAREEIAAGRLQCTTILIAEGNNCTGFTQSYILGSHETERLGVICSGLGDKDVNTFSQTADTDKSCYVYRLKQSPGTILVQCTTAVKAEQAYSWTEQLFSALRLDNAYVSVLCSRHTSEYKSEVAHGDLPAPFLRVLKSSAFKGSPGCPYLEQPNFLTGLPAQVLAYCEAHQVGATVYICYTDVSYVDVTTMKTFHKVLQSTPYRDVVQNSKDAESELVRLADLHAQHQNSLYI